MSIVTLLAQTFQYMYAGHICTGETGSFKLKASWNSFAWFLVVTHNSIRGYVHPSVGLSIGPSHIFFDAAKEVAEWQGG